VIAYGRPAVQEISPYSSTLWRIEWPLMLATPDAYYLRRLPAGYGLFAAAALLMGLIGDTAMDARLIRSPLLQVTDILSWAARHRNEATCVSDTPSAAMTAAVFKRAGVGRHAARNRCWCRPDDGVILAATRVSAILFGEAAASAWRYLSSTATLLAVGATFL